MAEDKLIGPQPIIGPGESPDVVGGDAPTTEYAPMNEAARRAIFGVNPATGKAYTDTESAAANAGYNPWAGAVGYQIDPRTGNLNILMNNGTVGTTGATYQTTSQGAIVPSDAYMQDFNKRLVESGQLPIAFDEYGVQVTLNPDGTGVDSKGRPLTIVYDAGGNPKGSPAAFVASNVANQSGSNNNPFVPGSDAAKAWNERKSAYDLLYTEFNKYGLGTLIEPLKNLVQEGVSPSEFAIQLRNTPQYQKRFAANAKRVQNGLAALNEAQYIGLEDQYQNIMRNYGLPEQYYARGDLGIQQGFEQFIGNDVSPVELEDRIQTAERRVRYANPEVGIALKTFYPDITNGDVLAYALDPKTALESLKRRITAAEVGSTAVQLGLTTNVTDAEYLARYGVTKAQAQQGYQTIAGGLQRGSQLASIYGENPYTQTTAEQEVFNVPGATEARAQRQKLTGLEKATFGGQTGVSSSALARERAGGF